ncbi:Ubiquitin carboxyl-terminal hydrolase 64E [Oryzias melastigma]|uniref:Ubiquitin carboxyl-terminal hydrolase n=1 Tax=Oryzias melastigma TaxID=30732 RepID=A0A834CD56_ORYME|nr:Ubiquitin carboxyl-terminal hydrolase 64E [Oryzias melastigma]
MSWCSDPKVSYNGLMNHGATCYLNSVLQVLFMTEDFREAVNRNSNTKFIDHHLKDLFDRLKKEISDTSKILKVLDINTVNQQQDAAEYCQKILKLTSPEAAKIFHAELTNRRFCSSCNTETDTDESFWILPLSLVDSSNKVYSVEDGIKEFFKESYFTGEDQMYCEHCDTKVDARTKYVVKHHPEVLILLLKRFDFSYRYMTYVKINDRVDVATTLKIPENQTYELYAVVDHVGDLRSGHYTSRIRSQVDERWYQFDDTWVTKIDDNINICSAGSKTAFLLFYRKKDTSLKESSNSHNHHPTPKPKDEAKNQNNDQINIEDTTLSASSSPNHQQICVPDNPDPAERNGDEDMRRRSNRDEPEDGARIKHKEDKTLKKPKRSKTKKKKRDEQVGELSEEIKKPPAHDEPKIDVVKKPVADLKQHSKTVRCEDYWITDQTPINNS